MNCKTKLIAFHLPQFHTFPENDKWWGKGFTEWTNTKKALRIYPEHNQPREPLDNHYYDLSNLDEMLWQMRIAEEYEVYGFCYYHYWFNGKRLLHKPLEMIRDYNGHKLPYCLCWANEPWTRTWEGKETTVLMDQEYGGELEWEKHFQYLLTFFEDPAYIKIDGAPMFVLYRTNSIPRVEDMANYLQKRIVEEGYTGLYLVEEINSYQERTEIKISNAVLEFEPLYSMSNGRTFFDRVLDRVMSNFFNRKYKTNNLIYSYDYLWRRIISNIKANKFSDKSFFPGAFVDWDNTARKGKRSRIVIGCTPEKFGKYLSNLKQIAETMKCEYIFINAWNEWGEGTYLEPDKKNKYRFLEETKKIFCDL